MTDLHGEALERSTWGGGGGVSSGTFYKDRGSP